MSEPEVVEATDISFEELIRDEFMGASSILSLLAHGADSYFPRPGVSPDGSTDSPFLVVRFGAESGYHQTSVSCQIFVYDLPARRYWRIMAIMNQIRLHFNGRLLALTAPGYRRYDGARMRFEGVSGQLTDGGWNKNMMFGRLSAMGL